MATLQLNGKTLATQASSAEPVLGSNLIFPSGHVLQVQYSELLNNLSTTSMVDTSTGLFSSITPSSATNYILAEFHVEGANVGSTYACRFNIKVTGGGTDGIIGAGTGSVGSAGGSRVSGFKCIAGGPLPSGAHGHNRMSAKVRFRCNDSTPNWSSGALTVTLMFSTNNSSNAAYINWAAGADNSGYSACSSQLILTEIKG